MPNKKNVKNDSEMLDYSKITNEEIKNYVRDIELRKKREYFLRERLLEEDSKINVLNKNINKLDSANMVLESEASKTRSSTRALSGEIAGLKMQLSKARAESKLQKVKRIKIDILNNARILKDQESMIESLRAKREEVRKEQEIQRNKLFEKREAIDKIKNETVNSNLGSFDEELVGIIESTLSKNSDKTRIMSTAIAEASTEMERIRKLDAINSSRSEENIELLKTQMFKLGDLNKTDEEKFDYAKQIEHAERVSLPNWSPSLKKASDIETETKLVNRLDKLVLEGLITEEDKQKELSKHNNEGLLPVAQPEKVLSSKKQKKRKK